mmetsp:Transcript_8911/g.13379  ORF Transcript_8911/g.13379 Transcript_8911/m.13379 type:complete len:268 (-) Transcript_8911:155-958(-)
MSVKISFLARFFFFTGLLLTLLVIYLPDEMFFSPPRAHVPQPMSMPVTEDTHTHPYDANVDESGASYESDPIDETPISSSSSSDETPTPNTEEIQSEESIPDTESRPDTRESYVNIKMTVRGGPTYEFEFLPSNVRLIDLAVQFCDEHGKEFGVTPETMISGCVAPVTNHLKSKLPENDQRTAEKNAADLVNIPLVVHGVEVTFKVDVFDPSAPEESATEFCLEHGEDFGVTAATLSACESNIRAALQQRINQHIDAATEHSHTVTA